MANSWKFVLDCDQLPPQQALFVDEYEMRSGVDGEEASRHGGFGTEHTDGVLVVDKVVDDKLSPGRGGRREMGGRIASIKLAILGWGALPKSKVSTAARFLFFYAYTPA